MNQQWTIERHLLGKPPEVIALYHRFIELAQACGPFTYAVSKSAITLMGTRRGFAGASPGKHALSGYLDPTGAWKIPGSPGPAPTPNVCGCTTSA